MKKLLSVLLVVAMIAGAAPINAIASEDTGEAVFLQDDAAMPDAAEDASAYDANDEVADISTGEIDAPEAEDGGDELSEDIPTEADTEGSVSADDVSGNSLAGADDISDEDAIPDDAPVTSYDLWVGSYQVTSENMDKIPGIKGGGKASFDPVTKTLTFTGNVTGVTDTSDKTPIGEEPYPCMIYSEIDPLTIAGKASFTDTESTVVIGAIRKVIIDGDITVKAQKSGSYALGINGDLIVNGTLNVEGDQNGIKSEGKVSVNGSNLTAKANIGNAINSYGEFTLNGGSVSAKSSRSCGILASNKLIMSAGEILAEAPEGKPAIEIGRMSSDEVNAFQEDLVISEPDGGKVISSYYNSENMTSIGLENNKPSSKISMKKVKSYDLWVGDTQVTSENMDNIPGIKGGGKASYNPGTNTLTFTGNVTGVTGTSMVSRGSFNLYYQICCYVTDAPLTIKGNAALHNNYKGGSCGIYCSKGLIIEDDLDVLCEWFALSVRGGSLSVSGNVNAEATGTLPGFGNEAVEFSELIVDGGALKAKGPGKGLSGEKIDIVSGTVEAESTDKKYPAIEIWEPSDKQITLSDDVKIVEPVGGKLSADGKTIVEADGTTKASKVKIAPADGLATVSFHIDSKYGVSVPEQNIKIGEKVHKPADPKSAAGVFQGWYTTEECVEKFDFDTPIIKDTVVYGKWRGSKVYTVTFDVNGHGEDWEGFGSTHKRCMGFSEGEKAIDPGNNPYGFTNPPDETDWHFAGWYTDPECTQIYDFDLILKGDLTLYAGWVEPMSVNRKPVKFDLGEMKDEIPGIPMQLVNYGECAKEPASPIPPAGSTKVFEAWYADSELTNKYDFTTPITDATIIYAGWADGDGFSVYFSDESYDDDALTWNEYRNRFEHIYTGAVIRPAVVVTDVNGNPLKEGSDYTLKYANNKNVDKKGRPATVTVTGKGNFRKSKVLRFYITAKPLMGNTELSPGISIEKTSFDKIVVEANKAPAPILYYNSEYNADNARSNTDKYRYGMRLTAANYTIKLGNGKKKFGANEKDENLWITITGKGNFSGTIEKIPVEVRTKDKMRETPLTVNIKKGTVFTYDGKAKELDATQLTIKGRGGATLSVGSDVTVQYANNINVGTARVIVTGINYGYQGLSVTKTFKILPDKSASTVTASITTPEDELVYNAKAITPQFLVTAEREGIKTPLVEGRDYKVTCSNNVKAGNKAAYKVTFMGNYKGRKPIAGKFTIKKAKFGKGIDAIGLNKVYSKPGKYTTKIYVYDKEDGNRILSSKDYTIVSYVTEGEGSKDITKDKKYTLVSDAVDVNVTIRGRGNYEGIEATFSAYSISKPKELKDLTRCKIVAKGKTKGIGTCTYDGNGHDPSIDVLIKNGNKWEPAATSEYDTLYLNNVNKGTATVIVGANRYTPTMVGSKTATFKITQRGLAGFLQRFM